MYSRYYEGEPREDDTETLVGQIYARLSRVSGLPYPEIQGLVQRDDSLVSLRNLCDQDTESGRLVQNDDEGFDSIPRNSQGEHWMQGRMAYQ